MADPTLRLFFALWPDPATRAVIAKLAQEIAGETKGRAVDFDNLHLTLAFLGARPAASIGGLCALAAAIETTPFQLVLDEIGGFRKTGIAWLGAMVTPPELIALQGGLARSLRMFGIELDHRPFAPHLTLARHAVGAVRHQLAEPVVWEISSFALVSSQTDRDRAHYRVVETWQARAGS